jgi:hypothetical protein
MDFVECPECGRAYTWAYIHGGFYGSQPVLEREHTIVCHCGTAFDFAAYEDKEDEVYTETIEEYRARKWWNPASWGTKQVVVTEGVPRLYQVYQTR